MGDFPGHLEQQMHRSKAVELQHSFHLRRLHQSHRDASHLQPCSTMPTTKRTQYSRGRCPVLGWNNWERWRGLETPLLGGPSRELTLLLENFQTESR